MTSGRSAGLIMPTFGMTQVGDISCKMGDIIYLLTTILTSTLPEMFTPTEAMV